MWGVGLLAPTPDTRHSTPRQERCSIEKLGRIYGVDPSTKYAKEYANEEKEQRRLKQLLTRPIPTEDEPYLSYAELYDWRAIVEFWLETNGVISLRKVVIIIDRVEVCRFMISPIAFGNVFYLAIILFASIFGGLLEFN